MIASRLQRSDSAPEMPTFGHIKKLDKSMEEKKAQTQPTLVCYVVCYTYIKISHQEILSDQFIT
jgi:hypothetical protein